jgi:[ribosomal protein S18]-alanine N-acetyltransferase
VVVGKVTLRPATEADISVIVAIQEAAFWSNFNELEPGSSEYPGYFEMWLDTVKADSVDEWPTTTIAETDSKSVGLCMLSLNLASISGLWVMPEMQGKGIGSTLIKNAFAILKNAGISTVEIDTHQRNFGAIKLYERMGFEIDRHEPRFSKGLQRDIPIVYLKLSL